MKHYSQVFSESFKSYLAKVKSGSLKVLTAHETPTRDVKRANYPKPSDSDVHPLKNYTFK